MKVVMSLLLLLHGAIHLLGVVKAFRPERVKQITNPVSKSQGMLWLVVVILFLSAGYAFYSGRGAWWMIALPAVIISQVLIFLHWKEAKAGTIANLIILLVIIASWGSDQFYRVFVKDVRTALKPTTEIPPAILTQSDIDHLPDPVRRYIRFSGCIGKPKVKSWKISFDGQMRGKTQDWFPFHSEQYNTLEHPQRMFFMKGRMKGMEVPGYHHLSKDGASMCIKLFGLIPIIDHRGPVMDTSDAVTFFNDMCLMAPATLIDPRITWQEIDSHTVKATMQVYDIPVTAVLSFDEQGRLINFISDDRYDLSGQTPQKLRFSTPVTSYRDIRGQQVMDYGEAAWQYPEGEFVYGRFKTVDVVYNPEGL